jgi:hypothetical protein
MRELVRADEGADGWYRDAVNTRRAVRTLAAAGVVDTLMMGSASWWPTIHENMSGARRETFERVDGFGEGVRWLYPSRGYGDKQLHVRPVLSPEHREHYREKLATWHGPHADGNSDHA